MLWWVYKCNNRQHEKQKVSGEWNEFFFGSYYNDSWGNVKNVPALADLKKDDMIIAYQTERNELVGVVQVQQPCAIDGYLYLKVVEPIGVKVRPLKRIYPIIADIPAFRPGEIKTIYPIKKSDASRLLKAAKHASKFNKIPIRIAKDVDRPPSKYRLTTYRILRDTALARNIKDLYRYRCQFCDCDALHLANGIPYAEAHHIKPLGSHHKGLDVPGNILCVCPNCHVLLDYCAVKIKLSKLKINPGHNIEKKYIAYHNARVTKET